ncbi:MAG: ribbon-helix-helix domain-containing protein [Bacteroidia bacterium]
MATFTSSLPNDVWEKLNEQAAMLSVPKNRLIEKALRIYLEQLTRAEYIRSYQEMSGDVDILSVAEEGMADYLKQVDGNEG